MASWATKGIEKGYGDGVMHDWSDEENKWDKESKRFRFWVDMGSCDLDALVVLYSKFAKFESINKVKLGSRYQD